MQNFIQKKNKLTEGEVNELLYYYKQGINIGKEEIYMTIVNNMNNLNFDIETISKITSLPIKKIKNYMN